MENAIFPLEIFQHIVDYLPQTSAMASIPQLGSFRNCSLVCKDFVALCRPHIFRDIELGIYRDVSVSRSRLIEVLEKNPNISSYVKSVRYTLNSESEEDLITRNGRRVIDYSSIYNDHQDPSLHTFFLRIESLSIDHGSSSDREHRFSPCFQSQCYNLSKLILQDFSNHTTITSLNIHRVPAALQDVLSLPSLHSLTSISCQWLGNYTPPEHPKSRPPCFALREVYLSKPYLLPIKVFEYCPKLSCIDAVENVVFSSRNAIPVNTAQWSKVVVYRDLRSVAVKDTFNFALLCGLAEAYKEVAFPALQHLDVQMSRYRGENDDLYRIMDHAPNIESLRLSHLRVWENNQVLQLNRCFTKCLRTLRNVYLGYDSDDAAAMDHPVLIRQVCDALSSIKSRNRLESITLVVGIEGLRINRWMDTMLHVWGTFDELLVGNRCSGFPYLTEVNIDLSHKMTLVETEVMNPILNPSDEPEGILTRVGGFWRSAMPRLHTSFTTSLMQTSLSVYSLTLTRCLTSD